MKSKKTLSNKEKRDLLSKLTTLYGENIDPYFQKSTILQSIKTDEGTFIVKSKKIVLFLHNDNYLPSINFLREIDLVLPKIVVDVGAIKFITNGADVMAPGIVFFDKNINNSLVYVYSLYIIMVNLYIPTKCIEF